MQLPEVPPDFFRCFLQWRMSETVWRGTVVSRNCSLIVRDVTCSLVLFLFPSSMCSRKEVIHT